MVRRLATLAVVGEYGALLRSTECVSVGRCCAAAALRAGRACALPPALILTPPAPLPAASSGSTFSTATAPTGWAIINNDNSCYALQLVPGAASTVLAMCRMATKVRLLLGAIQPAGACIVTGPLTAQSAAALPSEAHSMPAMRHPPMQVTLLKSTDGGGSWAAAGTTPKQPGTSTDDAFYPAAGRFLVRSA